MPKRLSSLKRKKSAPTSKWNSEGLKRTETLFGASSTSPHPVLHKQDFVPRYKAGEFGNASPTWNKIEDWLKWAYDSGRSLSDLGRFHVRNRIAQGPTWYNIPATQLDLVWDVAMHRVGEENLYISAMAPHYANLLQGEVWQSTDHLELTYSTLPDLPMRDALREGLQRASGIRAVGLLRASLCPNSLEWLNQLLDNYPGHVIEFSTFSTEWGTVPGYNTVFWECRRY